MPAAPAIETISSCIARPAASVSAKPAEKTIAALTPRAAHSRTACTVPVAGTARIATSGVCGSAATDGKAFTPCTVSRFGLTG